MMDRLRAIPGIDAAAFAYPLPLDVYGGPGPVYPEGWTPRSESEQNIAGHSRVSARYFEPWAQTLSPAAPSTSAIRRPRSWSAWSMKPWPAVLGIARKSAGPSFRAVQGRRSVRNRRRGEERKIHELR